LIQIKKKLGKYSLKLDKFFIENLKTSKISAGKQTLSLPKKK